jgi:plasmid stabilization system protein ParE
MAFTVEITRRALLEIDQTLNWLAHRSPLAAARWHRQLLQAVSTLEANPRRCPLAPETDWSASGDLRQLLYGKRHGVYRIIFEIRGTIVYILRVRHSAQDLLSPDEL